MARSTINLDKLPKLQRWAGKQTGEKMSIGQVLEWLETDAAGDLKSQLHPMLVRDTVRLGSVDNLEGDKDVDDPSCRRGLQPGGAQGKPPLVISGRFFTLPRPLLT